MIVSAGSCPRELRSSHHELHPVQESFLLLKKHCNVIWQAFPLTSGDLPKIICTKVAVFCTNHVRGRARNYWKILTWVILEYLPILYTSQRHWWLSFIVQTPSPPAQGWNCVFIPAMTMYLGTGQNELQVCMSSLERMPHTFKVKFRSRFISKSCISALEVGNSS